MGSPGLFGFCRASRRRRLGLARVSGPLYHASRPGHGRNAKAGWRQPGIGNTPGPKDRRDGRCAGPARVDPPHNAHIPDPGRHCQRFYGAYSNRARVTTSSAVGDSAGSAADARTEKDNSDFFREARST
jgi:hypothetical protein